MKSTVNHSIPETAFDCMLIWLDKSHIEFDSIKLLGIMAI